MNYKLKVNLQGQLKKVFHPGVQLKLSIIFNFGNVEQASISTWEQVTSKVFIGKPPKPDNDEIKYYWRYGRLIGNVWIKALNENLFMDEVAKRFNEIRDKQEAFLREEKEVFEKALTELQKYKS